MDETDKAEAPPAPLYSEQELRIKALEWAMDHGHPGEDNYLTVGRAKAYFTFLKEGRD